MDYRDNELHDFEEMGTRADCIRERSDAQEFDEEPHEDRMDVIRKAAESVARREAL